MKLLRIAKNPNTSFIINAAYAVGNCAVGFVSHSWWFITVGAYYTVLAAARFSVLKIGSKPGERDVEFFARRITGVLLVALSFCLIGVNILAAVRERGTVLHEIIMIAVAVYTFTKITLAVIGMAKARCASGPVVSTLRNIALADAVVSVYTLQRSMLVSFPGMNPAEIRLMNILTGTAVWLVVLFLGINLIGGRRVDMAKSKIVTANEKITEVITGSYKKIENSVVRGYEKMENGVVGAYAKVEDRFVAAYLAKDGETVEEAKARLKKGQ